MAATVHRIATWSPPALAQLRKMLRMGAPLRVVALRLGRTETAVRLKIIEISGRLPDKGPSRRSGGTSSSVRI